MDTIISVSIAQPADLVKDKDEKIRNIFDLLKHKENPLIQIDWAKGPVIGKIFIEGFEDEKSATKFIEYELL